MPPRRSPARVSTIRDLTADPKNARRHTDRNVSTIATALRKVGAARSIVIDEQGVVLAGNATIQAAAQAGITKVRVVDTAGDEIVAVRRAGLTTKQKAELAVYDNRAAELAEWDAPALHALEADGLQLTDLWTDKELAAFAGAASAALGRGDVDVVPEPRATSIQAGHLFALGGHQLLCGDATRPEDVSRLLGGRHVPVVVTDPPYAIFGSSTGVARSVADDKMVRPFFEAILQSARTALERFGHAYVFCDWRSWAAWTGAADRVALALGNMLVWDKGDFGLGTKYRNNHELVAFFELVPTRSSHWKKDAGHRLVRRPNILRYPRTGTSGWEREHEPGQRFHNAAKPVALCQELITNSSKEGEGVVDLCLGSGSVLMAAQVSGRSCYGLEIDPRCCQVIIDRWEAFTGQKAKKIGEVRHGAA